MIQFIRDTPCASDTGAQLTDHDESVDLTKDEQEYEDAHGVSLVIEIS